MDPYQADAQNATSPTTPQTAMAADPVSLATREPVMVTPSSSSSDFDRMVAFDSRKKSMGVAYLMWWLFGIFGGHRFYFGRTGSGTAMLCISLISMMLMIVAVGFVTIFVTVIWSLVDAFLIPGWVREHNAGVARELGVHL